MLDHRKRVTRVAIGVRVFKQDGGLDMNGSKRCTGAGLAGLMAGVMLAAGVARADVFYEVGPGQTYTTIQAALAATPFVDGDSNGEWDPFTENHVINVHGGTYTIPTQVDTDLNSRLNNGKLSRTSLNHRLVIQAAPGEEVVWDATGTLSWQSALQVRESHVTVQGIKFTGMPKDPGRYYILMGTGSTSSPNQRGGLLVYNCEFDGAYGLKGYTNTAYPDIVTAEPGVGFNWAFVNNHVHGFDVHYEIPGQLLLKTATLGNLYEPACVSGGGSILQPKLPAGYENRWYVNNTLASAGNELGGFFRVSGATTGASAVTFANNIMSWRDTDTTMENGMYFDSAPTGNLWPTMANNIQDGTYLNWAAVGGTGGGSFPTLGSWLTYLSSRGGTETGSYDDDPLFEDAADGDYRLSMLGSPGDGTSDTSYWLAAINDLGIGGLLSYYNAFTDPGLQFGTPTNVGAMVTAIPEPASLALLAATGLLALHWRRRG